MLAKDKLIFHIITGLNDGGAEAVLYRLCIVDAEAKHHVISLMDGGKYGPLLEKQGIPVTCLGMPQGRITLSGVLKLWRLLRDAKPGVVQTWMYHSDLIGGVIARLAGVRSVFWGIRHSNLERGESRRATIFIAHICAKLSFFIPKKIICCAERAKVVHQELGYKKEKLIVIPNGYDLQRFSPNDQVRMQLRSDLEIEDEVPLLGMVGRFDPLKDHQNLMVALSTLKERNVNFRCVLIGRGMDAENEQLAAWLQQYGLQHHVQLLGQRSDIPAVMNALDVHVLASRGEAFPNVVAEAMACGTPCVTTDVGDASLIVGETGWIVPPQDGQALADALQSAIEGLQAPGDWSMRCLSARKRVEENFSLEKMSRAYQEVWQH